MAVTITRSIWIDDDGTGTTGTVINQALHTTLYNEIDTALAKVPQLTGGNTFTGSQVVAAGTLTVNGLGSHAFTASGAGLNSLTIQNTAAGATNGAALYVGNDHSTSEFSLQTFSTTYTSSGLFQAGGTLMLQGGAGGLTIVATHATGGLLKFGAGGPERLRITPTGEVLINSTTNALAGQLGLVSDLTTHQAAVLQNSNPSNSGNYVLFLNSAGATAGNISQTGAATIVFGTTSDVRLKDDRGRAQDLTGLRAVVVHDFTWKADGVGDRGIFAQDAHAHYPHAIVEGSDDRTASGDLARPWMTDYSKFVPDLIVGWQQHDAAIAELRAALAAAKG